jgi:thymidine kinase
VTLSKSEQSRLVVIHGPMFAGKSTEIVRRVAEARSRGERVLVVKPERDTRYAADAVVTHAGERIEAANARVAADILALVAREVPQPGLVVIDEIHFFASDAVEPIDALLARGISVVVAGCDIDHFGDIFAPFDALLPRADERVHKTGTCARCGAPSTHSERLVPATDRIIIGGAAEFIATCAACFRPSRR